MRKVWVASCPKTAATIAVRPAMMAIDGGPAGTARERTASADTASRPSSRCSLFDRERFPIRSPRGRAAASLYEVIASDKGQVAAEPIQWSGGRLGRRGG